MSLEEQSSGKGKPPEHNAKIENWFRRYSVELRRYIVRNCGNQNETDDLLHDAFVVAMQKMSSYHEEGHARAYLYRITKNLILARRRMNRSSEISGMSESDIEGIVASRASTKPPLEFNVKIHLARLSADERLVIRLRIEKSTPFKKIAEILECPPNTAISIFHRSMIKLRNACARDRLSRG